MSREVPHGMRFQYRKGALAGGWIVTAGLIGVLGNVTSMGAGALILGLGLIPPLILMLRVGAPPTVRKGRGALL
jgi:hypothetical protein